MHAGQGRLALGAVGNEQLAGFGYLRRRIKANKQRAAISAGSMVSLLCDGRAPLLPHHGYFVRNGHARVGIPSSLGGKHPVRVLW